MRKALALLVPCLLLAVAPTATSVADQDLAGVIDGGKLTDGRQLERLKVEITLSDPAADFFPPQTCWNETFDIHISGVTGELYEECHGDTQIVIAMVIWEEDSGIEGGGDDRVAEEWVLFPTGGLTYGVPFDYVFEDIHLANWCNEFPDGVGEFYVEVKSPCLPWMPYSPIETVPLIFMPTAPTMAAPADGATDLPQPITLQWGSRYNASYYQVQVDENNSFDTPLIDEQTGGLSYEVSGLEDGTVYYWRVRAYNNTCGEGYWSSVRDFETDSQTGIADDQPSGLPEKFSLAQNHPNPFNPDTDIEFALPHPCHVSLAVYNLSGQKVRTLVDETLSAGYKVVTWDGTNEAGEAVASGVYLYRIVAGDDIAARKMMMLK